MTSQPVYYATYVHPAGGSAGLPGPQYVAAGGHLPNAPAPSYLGPGVHDAYTPAPLHPGLRANGDNPLPPSYSDIRALNAKPPDRGGDKETASTNVLEPESRKTKWCMFLVGNLISVVGIVYELAELDVCFDVTLKDETFSEDDDALQESNTYLWMMILLVFGLCVDVLSAVFLSAKFHSPLDIKSAHKIPQGDTRNLRITAVINFLAPLSWCVVYLFGGLLSMMHSENHACSGGVGGSAFDRYLEGSGWLMLGLGVFMLGLSVRMSKAACCSASTPDGVAASPPPQCCWTTWTRDRLHKRVLVNSWAFDLGWQLQGAVLSYRIGAVSLTAAILIGCFGTLGEVLAALGSLAPTEVQEIVGPIAV